MKLRELLFFMLEPTNAVIPIPSLEETTTAAIFQRLTAFAARQLNVPAVFVTKVEEERQVFEGSCVLFGALQGIKETPISDSICKMVVDDRAPLIISDAPHDSRVKNHSAVTSGRVGAYAGHPIFDPQGKPFGAFCAIDYKPRSWSDSDLDLLRTMATQVMSELVLHERLVQMQTDLAHLQRAEMARVREKKSVDAKVLRTPLKALLLALDAMAEKSSPTPEQAEYLALAQRNGRALQALLGEPATANGEAEKQT